MLAVAGIFDLVVLGVVLLVAPVTHALCIGHEHAAIARHAVNEPALLFTRSLYFFFASQSSARTIAGLYPRIFGCTLTTYIPVAVLHEEYPTLPVSLILLPLPAPCLRYLFLALSLFLICVYVLRGCARACSRLSSLSHVYIRVYMSRRKSFSVCLLFFSLLLPTFVWSFSDLLFLSFSNTNTRNYDFSLIFPFFYYKSRFKKM